MDEPPSKSEHDNNRYARTMTPIMYIPEEEREQYEGHERRLDVENAERFGQFEFTDACIAMGIIKDNG